MFLIGICGVNLNGGKIFHPPRHRLLASIRPGCPGRQWSVSASLMFCRWRIGPPFYQNKSGWNRLGSIIYHFPIRPILKPKRILVIRVSAMRTTFVAYGLDLLHRSFVTICRFPISTNCAIHFVPHICRSPMVVIGVIAISIMIS
jgi:hypothetical protein